MALRYPDDAILPPEAGDESRSARLSLGAFVPIIIALTGIAAILVGGLTAREGTTTIGKAEITDPVITGSVAKAGAPSEDQIRHMLEMLDR